MGLLGYLLLAVLVGLASAGQKCTGNPRMYKGQPCASTTHYYDGHKGACGCGKGDVMFDWSKNGFSTAPNQKFFDQSGKGWCGANCGKCVQLTTTGGNIPGQGSGAPEGQTHSFMVTNLCPNESPNLDWCSQTHGHPENKYGYGAHFDLEDGAKQVSGMGWNNPEVTYKVVDCNAAHSRDSKCPSTSEYKTCQCSHSFINYLRNRNVVNF